MVIVVASRVAGQPIHSAIDMEQEKERQTRDGSPSPAAVACAGEQQPAAQPREPLHGERDERTQAGGDGALTAAIRRLRSAASSTSSSSSRCAYHRREKPPTASPASSR